MHPAASKKPVEVYSLRDSHRKHDIFLQPGPLDLHSIAYAHSTNPVVKKGLFPILGLLG